MDSLKGGLYIGIVLYALCGWRLEKFWFQSACASLQMAYKLCLSFVDSQGLKHTHILTRCNKHRWKTPQMLGKVWFTSVYYKKLIWGSIVDGRFQPEGWPYWAEPRLRRGSAQHGHSEGLKRPSTTEPHIGFFFLHNTTEKLHFADEKKLKRFYVVCLCKNTRVRIELLKTTDFLIWCAWNYFLFKVGSRTQFMCTHLNLLEERFWRAPAIYSKIPILRPPLELSKRGLKDHFWTVPKVVSNQRYTGWRKWRKE